VVAGAGSTTSGSTVRDQLPARRRCISVCCSQGGTPHDGRHRRDLCPRCDHLKSGPHRRPSQYEQREPFLLSGRDSAGTLSPWRRWCVRGIWLAAGRGSRRWSNGFNSGGRGADAAAVAGFLLTAPLTGPVARIETMDVD